MRIRTSAHLLEVCGSLSIFNKAPAKSPGCSEEFIIRVIILHRACLCVAMTTCEFAWTPHTPVFPVFARFYGLDLLLFNHSGAYARACRIRSLHGCCAALLPSEAMRGRADDRKDESGMRCTATIEVYMEAVGVSASYKDFIMWRVYWYAD